MVVDAMDLLHLPGLSGVCLVSNDSDFTPLAQRLRAAGLAVHGCGSKHASKAFLNDDACTTFRIVQIFKRSQRPAASQSAFSVGAVSTPECSPQIFPAPFITDQVLVQAVYAAARGRRSTWVLMPAVGDVLAHAQKRHLVPGTLKPQLLALGFEVRQLNSDASVWC